MECPVCFEPDTSRTIEPLYCGHHICSVCIMKIDPPRCPLCRTPYRTHAHMPIEEPESPRWIHDYGLDIDIEQHTPNIDIPRHTPSIDIPHQRTRRRRSVAHSAPSILQSTRHPIPTITDSEFDEIRQAIRYRSTPNTEHQANIQPTESISDRHKQQNRETRNRWAAHKRFNVL